MAWTNSERKFQGVGVEWSGVPGTEYSWERKFQGTNCPGSYWPIHSPGGEMAVNSLPTHAPCVWCIHTSLCYDQVTIHQAHYWLSLSVVVILNNSLHHTLVCI